MVCQAGRFFIANRSTTSCRRMYVSARKSYFSTIMVKRLGTLLRFWGFFLFTQVEPFPLAHKQCWTPVCRIFFQISTLYRVGEGRSARTFRKGCTVLRRNREMTEKYEYRSPVSRTFVQDCGYMKQEKSDLTRAH